MRRLLLLAFLCPLFGYAQKKEVTLADIYKNGTFSAEVVPGFVVLPPDSLLTGTELSFEEIWAATRGWLNQTWEDEVAAHSSSPDIDALTQEVSQKLVVHRDVVMLDENGAPILPKTSKTKKKKVIEVNETQISRSLPPSIT